MEGKKMSALFTTVLPSSSIYPDRCKNRAAYENKNNPSGTVVMSLTAKDSRVGLPMDVNLRLDCYGDNTCRLILEIAQFDVELEADRGTYNISETMHFTFYFENAGKITGEPDYTSATGNRIDVTAAYKANLEEKFNGSMTLLSIDASVKGTYPNANLEAVNKLTRMPQYKSAAQSTAGCANSQHAAVYHRKAK